MNPGGMSNAAVTAFRQLYPCGENYLVVPRVGKVHAIKRGDFVFKVCSTGDL